MPELYGSLQETLQDPSFFYVSGSPYQLYPFLRGFVQDNYPTGPVSVLSRPVNVTTDDVVIVVPQELDDSRFAVFYQQ